MLGGKLDSEEDDSVGAGAVDTEPDSGGGADPAGEMINEVTSGMFVLDSVADVSDAKKITICLSGLLVSCRDPWLKAHSGGAKIARRRGSRSVYSCFAGGRLCRFLRGPKVGGRGHAQGSGGSGYCRGFAWRCARGGSSPCGFEESPSSEMGQSCAWATWRSIHDAPYLRVSSIKHGRAVEKSLK